MKLLAFDTSTTMCIVGLLVEDQSYVKEVLAPKQQANLILPLIEDLLQAASLTLAELDALAYCCGPGSFTGVRIATAIAQGFALATGLPVIRLLANEIQPLSAQTMLTVAKNKFEQAEWVPLHEVLAVYQATVAP